MQMPVKESVFTLTGVDPIMAPEERKMIRCINIQLIWATFTHVGFHSSVNSAPLGDLHAPTEEDLWFCFTPER